jgi:hypothetical protein
MFDQKIYNQNYYQDHKEEHDKTTKEWAKNHPEYQSNYYQTHKEKKLKQASDSQKKNLKKIEARNRDKHHERKMRAFELLGNQCANPYNINHGDFSNYPDCLQIDHINGGGSQHHRQRQTEGIISDVIKDPNRKLKYQLLCANCNWIKRFIEKEHNQKLP